MSKEMRVSKSCHDDPGLGLLPLRHRLPSVAHPRLQHQVLCYLPFFGIHGPAAGPALPFAPLLQQVHFLVCPGLPKHFLLASLTGGSPRLKRAGSVASFLLQGRLHSYRATPRSILAALCPSSSRIPNHPKP